MDDIQEACIIINDLLQWPHDDLCNGVQEGYAFLQQHNPEMYKRYFNEYSNSNKAS